MAHIIESFFHKPRVLLPVIHARNKVQAQEQADLAVGAGADGVFFINHGGELRATELIEIASAFAQKTGKFTGVNQLGHRQLSFRGVHFHGMWTDDLVKIDPEMIYFGGVAFKYQPKIDQEDLTQEVERALSFTRVDVLTTSGDATGSPPDMAKILAIRAALGPDRAMAIASGISAHNVRPFLPHVQAFLVASSLEKRFGILDPDRVRELVDIIHEN